MEGSWGDLGRRDWVQAKLLLVCLAAQGVEVQTVTPGDGKSFPQKGDRVCRSVLGGGHCRRASVLSILLIAELCSASSQQLAPTNKVSPRRLRCGARR